MNNTIHASRRRLFRGTRAPPSALVGQIQGVSSLLVRVFHEKFARRAAWTNCSSGCSGACLGLKPNSARRRVKNGYSESDLEDPRVESERTPRTRGGPCQGARTSDRRHEGRSRGG